MSLHLTVWRWKWRFHAFRLWETRLYPTSVKPSGAKAMQRLLQGSTFVLGRHARQSPCDGFQGRGP